MTTSNRKIVSIIPEQPIAKPEPAATEAERARLSLKALAKAILARDFQPRVGEVRRLAEAVLAPGKAAAPGRAAKASKPSKSKKADRKKSKKAKKRSKKS